MSIDEIKEIFNIDVREKNRTDLHVYLRTLYVNNRLKDLNPFQIGKELNYNHATLLNCIKRLPEYRLDPLFMYIEKAFKTKDIQLIVEFKRLFDLRRVERQRALDYCIENKYAYLEKPKKLKLFKERKKRPVKKKEVLEFKKENLFIVCEKLRNESTYLNNKIFNEWNNNDWGNYYKITKNE